ncbi:MAG: hypothetical protein FWG17_06755 [Desulfovibrionaceae bacterium]|nr:hypothetical protein [Desulfovibrionaceae bacterium]
MPFIISSICVSRLQGNITRLLFHDRNLFKAIYGSHKFPGRITEPNNGAWWTNLEEDALRVPFGLGVLYSAPAALAAGKAIAAEYFEGVVIQSRQIAIQGGQAMVMENVTFMADRMVPWAGAAIGPVGDKEVTVQSVLK